MPLPLGIVGSEGKQIDVPFLEIYSGGTTNSYATAKIDGQGSIYTQNYDYAYYIKQYFSGIQDWTIEPTALTPTNRGLVLCVDNSGNMYLLEGTIIVKIDSYGNLVWSYNFVPTNTQLFLNGVINATIGSSGDIYVAFPYSLVSPLYGQGVVTIRINPNGEVVWTRQIPNPYTNWYNNYDFSRIHISVNEAASTYSVLFKQDGGNYLYSGNTTTGVFNYWNRGASGKYLETAVYGVTDPNGNTYFVMGLANSFGGDPTLYLVKVSFSGSVIWAKTITDSGASYGVPFELLMSADYSTMYIAFNTNKNAVNNCLIMSIDTNANLLWSNRMTTNVASNKATSMAISPVRNFLAVTASYYASGNQGVLYKLPLDGSGQSVTTIGPAVYTYATATPTITDATFVFNGNDGWSDQNTQSATTTTRTAVSRAYRNKNLTLTTYLLGS